MNITGLAFGVNKNMQEIVGMHSTQRMGDTGGVK